MRRALGICLLLIGVLIAERSDSAYYPASPGCTSYININQTASTDVKTLTNNGYICGIALMSETAQHVSVITGTGTTCATSPNDTFLGSTTAANGAAAQANVMIGWVLAAGSYQKTANTAKHICVTQDGSGRVTGTINYLDAP